MTGSETRATVRSAPTRPRRIGALVALLGLLAMAASSVASSPATATPEIDGNPDLPQQCGTDMTLIIDRSASIDDHNTTVAGAANALVSGLAGTGSKVQVISFSDTATALVDGATGAQSSNLSDLAFVPAESLVVPTFISGGLTNWDDALEMARRSPAGIAPLTVLLTDGNPTAYNVFHPDGHGLVSLPAEFEPFLTTAFAQARVESNLLKTAGTHILAVGIGSDINAAKLRLISGEEQITSGGDVSLAEGDWTMVEFNELKAMLEDFVTELCAPSVNITKTEIPADGPARPGDGWDFRLDLSEAPSVWESPAQPQSNTSATLTTTDGKANFKWENTSHASASGAALTEAARPGWVFDGVACQRRNYETNETTELTVTTQSGADGSVSWVVPDGLGSSDSVNCAVTNRQIGSSQIDVVKLTEPAGAAGAFDFELRSGDQTLDTAVGLGHGDTGEFAGLRPGTFDVVEEADPGFDLVNASCDDLGTEAAEAAEPTGLVVSSGQHWRCTFVNAARPGSIAVDKTASTETVDEPGEVVTFTVEAENTGVQPLTVDSITDVVDGAPAIDVTGLPGTCDDLVGASLASGASASCTFDLEVSGSAGAVVRDTVKMTATDANGVEVDDSAAASVAVTEVLPGVEITKTTDRSSVTAPGEEVTFSFLIENTADEPAEIRSLLDSVFGDLTGPSACDLTGRVLARADDTPGAGADTVTCRIMRMVSGNAGDVHHNVATVVVGDDDDNTASAADEAQVGIESVLPAVEVTKTDGDAVVEAPGGTVTYTVDVDNVGPVAVTVESIVDRVDGGDPIDVTVVADPISATTCVTGGEIAVEGAYICTFDMTVTGDGSTDVVDEVSVAVIDDEENTAEASDDERTPVEAPEDPEVVTPPTAPPSSTPSTSTPAPTVQDASATQPPPATQQAASAPPADLAFTGAKVVIGSLLGLAALIVGLGLVSTDAGRRRRGSAGS